MKNQFKYFLLITILLITLLMVSACKNDGNEINISLQEPTVTPIPVDPVIIQKPTYEVERGSISQIDKVTGRVGSLNTTTVSFGTEGRVSEIFFREGDMVQEGDLIAVYDNLEELQREATLWEIAVRRAEIGVERAQLYLDLALEDFWTTDADIQLKEWDLELAQLSYQELMLSLGEQLTTVEAAQLIAPMNGMITKSSVRVNQIFDDMDEVVTIADVNALSILVDSYSVDDVEALKEGMKVELTAFGDSETYTGSIVQMPYPYGTGPARDVDKYVYVDFDDPADKDGWDINDRFDINIEIANVENVLILPVEAVREFSGRTFVMVEDGDMQISIDVTPGLTDGIMVEILEGLEEGQIVIGQ